MSNPHKSVQIAYEAMGFCNPLSPETLDRTLAWARLKPGMRAVDVGCGNATMAAYVAEKYGLIVDALERSPAVSEIARDKLKGRGAPGKVTLHTVESQAFLKDAEPYDIVFSVGSSGVVSATLSTSLNSPAGVVTISLKPTISARSIATPGAISW